MPKPEKSEKIDELEDDKVQVVKDEPEDEKKVEISTEETKKEPQYVSKDEFEKSQKRNEYLNRKLEKTLKQLDQFTSGSYRRQEPVQALEIPDDISKLTPEQINQIAENDWQKAVEIKAELKARKVYSDVQKQNAEEIKRNRLIETLERSKQKVTSRYSDIEDPESEVGQLYIKVINEDPSLLQNVHGPEIAMYRMEEEMRKQGKQLPQAKQVFDAKVEAELQRRERIGVGNLPHGSNSSDSGVVTLTEREIQLADRAGIPRSEYAKMYKLGAREFKEGVSVDE